MDLKQFQDSPFKKMWNEYRENFPAPETGRKVVEMDYAQFCDTIWGADENAQRKLVEDFYLGDVFVFKGVCSEEFCDTVVDEAYDLWGRSDSSFHKMLDGCPDFHRIIDHETTKKYSISAIKHSYYFFPWNSDPLNLFKPVNDIWRVFKYFGGFPCDAYETNLPSDGVIDRLQVVQYPSGAGELKRHTDPIKNQGVILGVILSERHRHYESGGFFFVDGDGNDHNIEDHLGIGDVVSCYPTVCHGVQLVDPSIPVDWDSKQGRWYLGLYSNDSDSVYNRVTATRVAK